MPPLPDTADAPSAAASRVWQRLAPRVAASAWRGRTLVTVRRRDMPVDPRDDIVVRVAYAAQGRGRRPGEAERVRLVDLPAGAQAELPLLDATRSEWFVARGRALVGGVPLATHDVQLRPAGMQWLKITAGETGARVLVREGADPALPPSGLFTVPAAGRRWQTLMPGVARLSLAPPGHAGPYLLHLSPGRSLPVHRHARDEECWMVDGEMYIEDLLLQPGDYQVAPAGGLHVSVTTERGGLIYLHGDLEPELLPAGVH